jgi:hypothetical protein
LVADVEAAAGRVLLGRRDYADRGSFTVVGDADARGRSETGILPATSKVQGSVRCLPSNKADHGDFREARRQQVRNPAE